MTVRHQFALILMEIGVGQKKKKSFFKKKPDLNEEGTDQNCERSSFSPQHSHQNIGLLKRGLLILIGLSLCLHSSTSSAAISGFGAGGDVRGASNAGLHSRRTWPSSALSLPTCAFTREGLAVRAVSARDFVRPQSDGRLNAGEAEPTELSLYANVLRRPTPASPVNAANAE